MEKILLKEKENRLPVILTGDFNVGPNSEEIKFLNNIRNDDLFMNNVYDEFKSKNLGCTFHGFNGGNEGEPIDYIFVSTNIIIKDVFINRNKVNGMYPSDHYPILSILEI